MYSSLLLIGGLSTFWKSCNSSWFKNEKCLKSSAKILNFVILEIANSTSNNFHTVPNNRENVVS